MPKVDGLEVLSQVKADFCLKTISIIVLTAFQAEPDVIQSYKLMVNGSLSKPSVWTEFESLLKSLNDFWLAKVALPEQGKLPDRGERLLHFIGRPNEPLCVPGKRPRPRTSSLRCSRNPDGPGSSLPHVAVQQRSRGGQNPMRHMRANSVDHRQFPILDSREGHFRREGPIRQRLRYGSPMVFEC
jgi:CheY-like chemotaxis protein